MKYFSSIKNQIKLDEKHDDIDSFYHKVSIIMFRLIAFVLVPFLFYGSTFYLRNGEQLFALLEFSLGLLLFLIIYFSKPNYQIKQIIIMYILMLLSLFVLLTTGIKGGGFSSLVTLFAFIFLLIPAPKKQLIYIVSVVVFFIFTTVLLYMGVLDTLAVVDFKQSWPFMVVLIFTYVGTLYTLINFYKNSIEKKYVEVNVSKNHLSNLIDSVNSLILAVNKNQEITFANEKAIKFFSNYNLIGMKSQVIKNKFTLYEPNIPSSFFFNRNYYEYVTNSNEHILVTIRNNKMINFDKMDIGNVIVIDDVTEVVRAELELNYLNQHDQLTGLKNRIYLEQKLKYYDIEDYYPLSMIMIDINGLKTINESFGFIVGNQLLIEFSKYLQNNYTQLFEVARSGGDEFVILLPQTTYKETEQISQIISEESSQIKIENIPLSISLGIATKIDTSISITDVYKAMENDLIKSKKFESTSMRSNTIDLILLSLYEKNKREMKHSERVGLLSEKLARALGFTETHIKRVKLAGLMHDIGKIAIEESILNKKERLTDEEWQRCKQHPEIGYRILASKDEFTDVAQFVYEHHEKFDGSGYPKGLKGENICIEARIITITDSFDAMTGYRTYRDPLSKEEAITELQKNSGTHFDPEIVDIFIKKILEEN